MSKHVNPHGASTDDSARHTSRPQEGLVPGRKPVLDLVRDHPERIEHVVVQKEKAHKELAGLLKHCRNQGVRYSMAPKTALDAMHQGNHQGVVARVFQAGFVEEATFLQSIAHAPLPIALAMDQVQDPHNVGALTRTLYAMGGAGVLVTKHNAAALGSGAMRASAGALMQLPVGRAVNLTRALEAARALGVWVYGLAKDDAALNLFEAPLATPALFVLGNEDKGLRPSVAKACDALLEIPFARQFDSLNVAQTGALVIGRVAALRTSQG